VHINVADLLVLLKNSFYLKLKNVKSKIKEECNYRQFFF